MPPEEKLAAKVSTKASDVASDIGSFIRAQRETAQVSVRQLAERSAVSECIRPSPGGHGRRVVALPRRVRRGRRRETVFRHGPHRRRRARVVEVVPRLAARGRKGKRS